MSKPVRSLILASRSPRRLRLLRDAGYAVEPVPSHADETWPEELPPDAAVAALALRKATTVVALRPGCTILGADTEVVVDRQVLGKPATRSEAGAMIRRLAGKTHSVFTGVALVRGNTVRTACDKSRVTFRDLTDAEIEQYLDSAIYSDKAGAYGIQEEGRSLVASYKGRLDTIIGLPMNVVEDLWQHVAEAA